MHSLQRMNPDEFGNPLIFTPVPRQYTTNFYWSNYIMILKEKLNFSSFHRSEKHLLAACLSKLMTDDILPNAKNVKGSKDLMQNSDDKTVTANVSVQQTLSSLHILS